MAKWLLWTPEQTQMWGQWVKDRPPVIQEMIEKHNLRPDILYLYKHDDADEGTRVTIVGMAEDGTVTINMDCRFNQDNSAAEMLGVLWDRGVFGIPPTKLTECDLPQGVEPILGETLTEEADDA